MSSSARTDAPVLEVTDLRKYFPIRTGVLSRTTGHVKAVDGVSFAIRSGETFALVGESGCGKSTTGRTILRLTGATGGSIRYNGEDVLGASGERMRHLRKAMQIVFQDPYSALNPRMTVGAAITEILKVHGIATGVEARQRVEEVLVRCGLEAYHSWRYPHEFSGGQRQRVVIARALALDPQFIVADEPISALDVSIQSQIINLLEELQDSLQLTYLFISHDLSVVRHMADRVGVMYLGKLVEVAEKAEFYREPLHPYSQALLSAIPVSDPAIRKKRIILKGDVPSPANPPSGCPFHTRCPVAMDVCRTVVPALKPTASGRQVACHKVHPVS
ncbi:MAG: dipeptide ABC transporter ATP-binding protein [Spirochaetaceae bacterium]|nr:MAG: dipeptide ABC transporter ATP-binding protein [Spirochaetaceae bacterium]